MTAATEWPHWHHGGSCTIPSPRSVLLWPPWTQYNPKLHTQDALFFLLPCCWLHAHPLGDVKNHDEGRNKATRFSTISPKDLSLSAACCLPLLPRTTLSGPNINNVNKTLLEQTNNFYSIYLRKSSYYSFIVSSLLCLCSMETALTGAWKQNLHAALRCSWLHPCKVTGQQLSRVSLGVEKGLWQNWIASSVETEWNPATLCVPSWAVVEMKSWWHFFFSCSLPLCFLLLEPWSSSKWVLLCAPCDLQWQKRGKLPIKGYNCRNNRIKISSSSSTCYPSLCGSGNVNKSLQTTTSDRLPPPWVAEVEAQGSW